MSELTFRDFAGAVMTGNDARASEVLATLLELPPERAAAATSHFRTRMADPAFMPKAMGLRTAVTSGTDDQIFELLVDCFGVTDDDRATVIGALRRRYPAA